MRALSPLWGKLGELFGNTRHELNFSRGVTHGSGAVPLLPTVENRRTVVVSRQAPERLGESDSRAREPDEGRDAWLENPQKALE